MSDADKKLTLREYQKFGVSFLVKHNRVLLADDMGLGKTVQVISAFRKLFQTRKINSVLVVVPNGLISNWLNEIKRWSLIDSIVVIKGNKKERLHQYGLPANLTIASYSSIASDKDIVIAQNLNYDLLVLDEAQTIKNSRTKSYNSCKQIKSTKKWLMTGTPIENHISELANLINFIEPTIYSLEGDTMESLVEKLDGRIIRRTREQVLKELPEKIEETVYLDLIDDQKKEYLNYVEQYRSMSRHNMENQIFALITKLKQICNYAPISDVSVKIKFLLNLIDSELDNKLKILVFSQYVDTLEKIKEKIIGKDLDVDIYSYNGSMSSTEKDLSLASFKKSTRFSILLMSLKAGGVGLNLQEATNVVMFDRWWNPALESQAIARAHRMGRKLPLHVISFIVKDSIEEKIEQILNEKQEVIDFVDSAAQRFTNKIRDELLRYIQLEK